MTNITEFKNWLREDLSSTGVRIAMAPEQSSDECRVYLYTATNSYSIVAKVRDDGGYLGCISKCRKQRPGEDWNRGNDLPDGKLTKETWLRILKGIICYELQDISSDSKLILLETAA